MLKDFTLLIIGAVLGLGATVVAMAAPLYFPNAPRWVWYYAFWLGIAMMAITLGDGVSLLFFFKTLRVGTVALFSIGAFFIACAVVHQKYLRIDHSKKVSTPSVVANNRPSVLDLFMTDFKPNGVNAVFEHPVNFRFISGEDEIIYIHHNFEFDSNSRSASFYIPNPNRYDTVAKYIAKHVKEIAKEQFPIQYDTKIEGDTNVIKMDEMVFSGKIFIYTPAIFDAEVAGELTKLFREQGCSLQLRGIEYSLTMQANIQKYHSALPPEFVIDNGRPVLKDPPAENPQAPMPPSTQTGK